MKLLALIKLTKNLFSKETTNKIVGEVADGVKEKRIIKMKTIFNITFAFATTLFLISCGGDKSSTGIEFAPNMYVSMPLDPLTQRGDAKFNFNANNMTMREPVKGTISEGYNPKEKHFAVDIVTTKDAPVKATADGTVIFAEWTVETGYVIQLQHADNVVSIYKHNSEVLKKIGEYVDAGEPISIVGNSGEHSTGPHLHFELWHNGYPINPEKFINFQ